MLSERNEHHGPSSDRRLQELFAARTNIERFRSILAGAIEYEKRASVERLLAEEEAKLERLQQPGRT
jgi:hypothetical protein